MPSWRSSGQLTLALPKSADISQQCMRLYYRSSFFLPTTNKVLKADIKSEEASTHTQTAKTPTPPPPPNQPTKPPTTPGRPPSSGSLTGTSHESSGFIDRSRSSGEDEGGADVAGKRWNICPSGCGCFCRSVPADHG